MKRKSVSNGTASSGSGSVVDDGSVSIRRCDKPVGDCSVCSARRPIAGDALSTSLPISGRTVSQKFSDWWRFSGPDRDRGALNVASLAVVPVCQPCLDLVLDVEKSESHFVAALEVLWDLLKTSKLVQLVAPLPSPQHHHHHHHYSKYEEEPPPPSSSAGRDFEADVIRAAAMAAGIYDDNEVLPPVHTHLAQPQPKTEPPDDLYPALEPESLLTEVDARAAELVVRKRRGARRTRRSEAEQERRRKRAGREEPAGEEDYGEIVVNRVKQEAPESDSDYFPHDEDGGPGGGGGFDDDDDDDDGFTRAQRRERDDDDYVGGDDDDDNGRTERKKKKYRKRAPKKPITDDEIAFGSVPAEEKPKERPKYQPVTMCPICGKMLKGDFSKVFKKHVSLVHKQEKKFQCQFCQEIFKYRTSLYVHQAKVHQYGTERVSRPCTLCGKLISATFGMKQHLLTIHGVVHGGSRTYDCNRCDKRFLTPSRLREHLNSHDGIRPYGCPLCEVRMVRLENLQQHVRRVHKRSIRLKRREDPAEEPTVELV